MRNEHDVDTTWWLLRMTYGLVPIVAGADKFTNLLTDWTQNIAPSVGRALPMAGSAFMHVVGIIEILAGVLVLSRWTRFGGYLVAAWLTGVALQLVIGGHYDIAVRDVVMAIGAFSLARLTEARAAEAPAPRLQPAP